LMAYNQQVIGSSPIAPTSRMNLSIPCRTALAEQIGCAE
jgi:hypothetical protein